MAKETGSATSLALSQIQHAHRKLEMKMSRRQGDQSCCNISVQRCCRIRIILTPPSRRLRLLKILQTLGGSPTTTSSRWCKLALILVKVAQSRTQPSHGGADSHSTFGVGIRNSTMLRSGAPHCENSWCLPRNRSKGSGSSKCTSFAKVPQNKSCAPSGPDNIKSST